MSANGRYSFFKSAATTLVDGQTTTGTNLYRRDRTTNQTTKLAVPNPGGFAVSADGNQVAYDTTDPGYFGGDPNFAYTFDGTADRVQLPSGFANFGTGLTIEAWVNPTAVTSFARIVELGNGASNNNIAFGRQGTTDTLMFVVYNGATKVTEIDATNALVLNQWQHVAVTMTPAGAVTIYRNGVSIKTGTTTLPPNVTRSTNLIGLDSFGANAYWNGRMDEVSINTTALTSAQVLTHYQARYTGYSNAVKTNSPYGFWRLGEPVPATHVSSATAVDASGNGRDGTYLGNLYGFGNNGALTQDANDGSDVFVYNIGTGTTSLVGLTAAGAQPNATTYNPAMSADGNIVAFENAATNMISGDTNVGIKQVYVRNRTTNITTRESVSSGGVMLDPNASYVGPPALSGDGSKVAYQSTAWNLLGGDLDLSMASMPTQGIQSQVTVPNQTALNLTGNLTLEAWVYPRDTGAFRMIATKGVGDGSTNSTFQFMLDPTNKPEFVQYAGTWQGKVATATVPSYQWSHVAVTKSGTTVTFYINGVASGTGTISGAVSTNTNPMRIGAREDGFYFDQKIDEMAVYNTALLPARLLAHVQARTSGYATAVNADHPVGYWRLGEANAATTAVDASGNARNGTYAAGSSAGWRGALSNDTNELNDTFYRDRTANQTTRASVTSAGAQVFNANSTLFIAGPPLLSADGRVVAWLTNDPLDGQQRTDGDVFSHDMLTSATVRDSATATGGDTGGSSFPTSISADGRYLSFYTGGGAALGGDPDKSMQFMGGNVSLPTGFANFTTTGITIEAWADPLVVANNARIVDLGGGQASNNIVLTRDGTTNTLSLLVYSGATLAGRLDATNALELNKWQHFAATISAAGTATIYKNGSAINTGSVPVPPNVSRTSNFIGKSNWSTDAAYNGLLDEVAIYSGTLNTAQVLAHFQARSGDYKGSVLANTPLAYWRLGEAIPGATTATDTSGHALNGTYNTTTSLATAGGALGADTNFVSDVYVKDRTTGSLSRVSETNGGAQTTLDTLGGSLSADGRYIDMDSNDTALVNGDTNGKRDVFVRDRGAVGGFELASTLTSGLVAQSDELGLEQHEPYVKTDVGSGSAYTHLRTGNLVLQYDDTTVPAQGLNTVVRHTYNSTSQVDEGLGKGWSLSVADASAGIDGLVGEGGTSGAVATIDPGADIKVSSFGQIVGGVFQAAGQVVELTDGDGTTHRFVRQGPPCARWDTPPGVSLKIREEFDAVTHLPSAYEFVRPDGVVYRAEPITLGGVLPTTVWRVKSVTDRRGNKLNYSYAAYGPVPTKVRLVSVTNSDTRYPLPVASLQYTPAGDLQWIKSLPGYNTLDAASGLTRSWEREIDFSVNATTHQLTSVTENTQALPAGGTDGRRLTSFAYPTNKVTVTDGRNNPTEFSLTSGQVTNIKDRRLNNWTYSYGNADGNGGRTTIAGRPGGNATTYVISGRTAVGGTDQRITGGNITSIADAGNDGGPVTTGYEWTQNRLTKVTDGANAVTSYKYNDLGLLKEITKPSPNDPARPDLPAGAPTTAVTTVLNYGYPAAFRYDNSPTFGCTDPTPTPPTASIGNEGWCYMVAELNQVRLADSDSARRITDYGHDPAYGDVTTITQRANPDGSASPNDRTTTFDYYTMGGLKSVNGARDDATDVLDKTTYGDTADGTWGGYDRTGQPAKITDAAGQFRQYAYTPYGPVSQLTDRDGHVTKSLYDERNNLVQVTDPLGHVTAYRFDANDDPVAVTTPRGSQTATVDDYTTFACFDTVEELVKLSAPGETGLAPATDTCATPTTRTAGRSESLATYNGDQTRATTTSPIGGQTSYLYFNNMALQKITAPAGTGATAVTDFTYDRANRPKHVQKPLVNSTDRPTEDATYTPSGSIATYTTSSPVAGQSAVTKSAYNAFGETIDAVGPRTNEDTTLTIDAFGEVTRTQKNIDATNSISTFVTYDPAGNQKTTKQPTGQGAFLESDYTYDALNRVSGQPRDDANGSHTVTFGYNHEGQQTNRTDKVSNILYRTVDTLYNADGTEQSTLSTSYDSNGASNGTVTRCDYSGTDPLAGYDADGNLLVMRTLYGAIGCTGGIQAASVSSTYNGMGLPATTAQTVRAPQTGNNFTRTQSYNYNPDATASSIVHDGHTTTFNTYSPGGWLELMTDWRNRTTTNSYFASGALQTETRGGVATTGIIGYKSDGSIDSLAWSKTGGGALRSETAMQYELDGTMNGETVSATQTDGSTKSGGATMSFDAAGRLLTWKDPFQQGTYGQPTTTYTLDDGGNIKTERVTGSSSQQLALTTSTVTTGRLMSRTVDNTLPAGPQEVDTFTYSGFGEEIERDVTISNSTATSTTKYDPAGRMQSSDNRSGTGGSATGSITSYVYDGFDRLVARTDTPANGSAATTTLYFYWGLGNSLAEESDGSGATSVRYLTDESGNPIAQEVYATPGVGTPTWTWLLQNAHGDVATQVDDNGGVTEQDAYKPYGGKDANGSTPGAHGSTLGFGSAVTDSKTGTLVLGARQYDPTTARFITPDNLVAGALDLQLGTDTLTGNRFLFAAANPVSFFDNGHWGIHIGKWIKKHSKAILKTVAVGLLATVTVAAVVVFLPEIVAGALVVGAVGAEVTAVVASDDPEATDQANDVVGKVADAVSDDSEGLTSRIAQRAQQIHDVLDPIAQNSRTTAVLVAQSDGADPVDILAGGGTDLSPAQRALAAATDILAKAPGLHAEVTAVQTAINLGLQPKAIAATRNICPACAELLEDTGAVLTSSRTAEWLDPEGS
jgi:RHS repeat-associated protein